MARHVAFMTFNTKKAGIAGLFLYCKYLFLATWYALSRVAIGGYRTFIVTCRRVYRISAAMRFAAIRALPNSVQ
jgi:hypothetical protein